MRFLLYWYGMLWHTNVLFYFNLQILKQSSSGEGCPRLKNIVLCQLPNLTFFAGIIELLPLPSDANIGNICGKRIIAFEKCGINESRILQKGIVVKFLPIRIFFQFWRVFSRH